LNCEHEIYYEGAVNVILDGEVNGVVDIWKCRKCGKVHADARLVGEPKLPENVGTGVMDDLKKWGILVCRSQNKLEWSILPVGKEYLHHCEVYGDERLFIDDEGKVKCENDHEHLFLFIEKSKNSSLVVR